MARARVEQQQPATTGTTTIITTAAALARMVAALGADIAGLAFVVEFSLRRNQSPRGTSLHCAFLSWPG